MISVVSRSKYFCSHWVSALTVVGALTLAYLPAAHAGCVDRLLTATSDFSSSTFHDALTKPLPPVGALPEEVLAHLAGSAGAESLLAAIAELGIERLQFDDRFEVRGRKLNMRRPNYHTPVKQAEAALDLARALFRAKQRQLRLTVDPRSYSDELSRFSVVLEGFVYPAIGASAPEAIPEVRKGFRWFRYALRAFFGLTAADKDIWPVAQDGGVDWLTGEVPARDTVKSRATVHHLISRTVFAFYVSMLAMAAAEIPAAYDAASTLYKMRAEISQVVDEVDGYAIDGRQGRLALIERYEGKIAALEESLATAADEVSGNEMRDKISRYRQIIGSIELELKMNENGGPK